MTVTNSELLPITPYGMGNIILLPIEEKRINTKDLKDVMIH